MLGQITIGDYSVIGANAVCLRSSPPPPRLFAKVCLLEI